MEDEDVKKIEAQAVLWNKMAFVVPSLFLGFTGLLYYLSILRLDDLFLVAIVAWVITAIIWWWWTMTTVLHIAKVLERRAADLREIKEEIKAIRNEIT
jgi:hypothetical protein